MDLAQTLLDLLATLRLRKARALVFFLLADAHRIHRAEKIIDLFWQVSGGEKAAASFRQVVHHIRLALSAAEGVELATGGGMVALRLPQPFSLERALSESLCGSAWDTGAAARVRGFIEYADTLDGISASFDSWLAITKSALLSEVRGALDLLLADQASTDRGTARKAAEFAVELEPSNEAAVRFLMRSNWQAGRSTRAIELYNALYAHLDEVYDQEPEPETIALLAAIKLDPAGAGRFEGSLDRQPQVSLSVSLLPEPGVGREQASFSMVLFADLKMRMGRFREWRVVEDGGAERPKVRITLRPVHTTDDFRLFVEVQQGPAGLLVWSEAIDQPSRDWESKVRLLLANIANALSVVVADRSLADFASAVYDRWLKSQALLDAWSPQTEGVALSMLRDITREAPRFGPAHAELAGALNVRHVLLPGTRQTEDVKERALHHAVEAVSIDPLDTRAHRVLAWCYCHKGEFELAEFHFEQSLTLNRSSPLTLASCALGFAFAGNLGRAAALVAETKAHVAVMEPFHLIYLAAADYLCGNFAATLVQCERGIGLMSTVGGWHSAALWKLGRREDAARRLSAYLDEIRAVWRGPHPPGDREILDWFVSIFPLRHEAVREELRATLEDVARVDCSGP
jgi:DNA-binding SARP family transcriptional activator